jgi:hypothetical protein
MRLREVPHPLTSVLEYTRGYNAGTASVDITTDNTAEYTRSYNAGEASVDIEPLTQEAFDDGVESNEEAITAHERLEKGSTNADCFQMG